MAHVIRPLVQWPRWRRRQPFLHCPSTFHSVSQPLCSYLPFFAFLSTPHHSIHFRSRAMKLREIPFPEEEYDDEKGDPSSSDDDDTVSRSRNQKKRDARRAVRWGVDLAGFSPPQIKRILRVTALEQDLVFDAIMLVKRLGRDVKEGKRRQFNYIGRLIREADPELMDGLIRAVKDGDQTMFQKLSGAETLDIDDEQAKDEEIEDEDEEIEDEEDSTRVAVVERWFDGLVNKDADITNEIYSLREIEFDRQELRKLVRNVHSTMKSRSLSENEAPDVGAVKTRRLLTRFLRELAKELPS